MIRALLAVALALVLAAPAQACVKLPTKSATEIRISASNTGRTKRTAVSVCGHTFARATLTGSGTRHKAGTRIGEASAAGNRVAWIEERHANGVRTAIVTLADTKRVLRRFVVARQRTGLRAQIHVLLTKQGDLAWGAGTFAKKGVVAVKQPGKRTRVLDDDTTEQFALEDGRTLVWAAFSIEIFFFDLKPRKPCERRGPYKIVARSDRVLVSRAVYDLWALDGGATVYRGCDLQTGRDRVLTTTGADPDSGAPDPSFDVGGIIGTWVEFEQWSESPYGSSVDTTAVNVVSGLNAWCFQGEPLGPVITDNGLFAWIDRTTLFACRGNKKLSVLDRDGTLANLHVEGNTVMWTHDGVARSFTAASPPPG